MTVIYSTHYPYPYPYPYPTPTPYPYPLPLPLTPTPGPDPGPDPDQVIYSTHIFDGVDDWPTHLLHLKKGGVHYNGPLKDAPPAAAAAAASASTSGSLFCLVRGWLDEERAERRANAGGVEVAP